MTTGDDLRSKEGIRIDTARGALNRPTPLKERALGSDLARGFMLLVIALANPHYFLPGSSVLSGYPQDVAGVDAAVT